MYIAKMHVNIKRIIIPKDKFIITVIFSDGINLSIINFQFFVNKHNKVNIEYISREANKWYNGIFKSSFDDIPHFNIIICERYAEINMLKYVLNMAKHVFLKFCLNKNFKNKKNDIKFTKYNNGSFKKMFVEIAIIDADTMYIFDWRLEGCIDRIHVKNFS